MVTVIMTTTTKANLLASADDTNLMCSPVGQRHGITHLNKSLLEYLEIKSQCSAGAEVI